MIVCRFVSRPKHATATCLNVNQGFHILEPAVVESLRLKSFYALLPAKTFTALKQHKTDGSVVNVLHSTFDGAWQGTYCGKPILGADSPPKLK
jgi:hypothetical protein